MVQSTRPSLKVVGLHVEGLKALRLVDWPEGGMAWAGEVPDVVMVGGANGSGKTTLLELIAAMAPCLYDASRLPVLPDYDAWIDFHVTSALTGSVTFRVVVGDEAFVNTHKTAESVGFARERQGPTPYGLAYSQGPFVEMANGFLPDRKAFTSSDFPGVVYFPTDRQLLIPDEAYKAAGRLNGSVEFVHRFQPASKWTQSVEALLYAARWADLNAKDSGRPEEATHFESYARAFEGFFGAEKRLIWTPGGEVVVEIARGGAAHSINELSSGEKQALLFGAELHRRWRPGSLILIDEPELHLHPTWQTALWTLLERWQKERGGQVIVATQSNHLFGIAEPGTTVLLGQAFT